MAVVREEMDEIKCRIINLKENLDRKDLNILQEAKSISRLKELGVGEEYAASALNKSRGWVQVRYMLLDLPEEIQAEAAAGVIRQSDIRSIYSQPDRNLRLAAAKKIKESVIRGESKVEARLKSQPKRATDKRVRNKVEIILMQDRVRDAIGNGIATRALAWCVGEINDGEFFGTIKEVAEDMGLEYTVPKDGEY
jgi:ParB-like chromosome segregation protein Spo0J